MSVKVTIALDVMGGDHGPVVVVPAALATLEKDDTVSLVLVGVSSPYRNSIGAYSLR